MSLFGTSYDSWKTATPGQYEDGAPARAGCRVCKGGDGPPCGEACDATAKRAAARVSVRRHRDACRLAMRLIRAYRAEGDGLTSPRLVATLARYGELRAELRRQVRAAR